MDLSRKPKKPPPTLPYELQVGKVVQVPDRGEGTIRQGPKTPSYYNDPYDVQQQHEAALNKYTVELVNDGSIVYVAPDKVEVSVPITGLQLPGWDEVKDTAGIARQLLKKTTKPQRLLVVATAGTLLGAKPHINQTISMTTLIVTPQDTM